MTPDEELSALFQGEDLSGPWPQKQDDCSPEDPGEDISPEDDEKLDYQRRAREIKLQLLCEEENQPLYTEIVDLLREAAGVPGDSGTPQDLKPAWYDPELFKDGQRCVRRYMAGICESQLLSLFLMFVMPNGTDPLVATGKSDTPFKAFQRYLSTGLRVLSWCEGDPFDPNSLSWKNLVAVRRLHASVRKMCHNTPREELAVKFTVGKTSTSDSPSSLWCPMTPFLVKEFSSLPEPKFSFSVEFDRYDRTFLSQGEMGVTQYSFFGLFLLHPELFGAPNITRREQEGLVHMWAILAHCLGVMDKYNWCEGGLEKTKVRSRLLEEYIIKKSFRSATPVWEHMGRCAFEGIKMYAVGLGHMEAHLAYLFEDVLQMHTLLPQKLSWSQWFQLQKMRFFFQVLPRWCPSLVSLVSRGVRAVSLRAAKFSKDKLRTLQEKKYPIPEREPVVPAS